MCSYTTWEYITSQIGTLVSSLWVALKRSWIMRPTGEFCHPTPGYLNVGESLEISGSEFCVSRLSICHSTNGVRAVKVEIMMMKLIKLFNATFSHISLQCFFLQCFDTVGWATGRASGLLNTGCWFVGGGDDLTGALYVL